MKEIQYGNLDFLQPQNAWEALSQKEKADVMKVAVRRGITDLATIRQMYNEFAEGGNLYYTGGDTSSEVLKTPSLSESKRLGVMVGIAPFVRPKGYIGGTPAETRDKYWQTDTEMRILTDSVANQYGINPDLLRSRLDHEGFTDERIADINAEQTREDFKAPLGEELFKKRSNPYVATKLASEEFGLDDVADYINNGTVNLINERWGDGLAANEKGRDTNVAVGDTYGDNIGIMAATLKAMREQARKDFPWASDADLDRYAQAYYNRGIAGGKKWVQNGAKGYKVTKHSDGGNLYDGGGYVYDVLPKLMKEAGLDIRVTSGYREPGKVGKARSKSWHGRHGAVDIVPQGKTTFEDIESAIYNNPTISNYMLSNGFGLIDESGRSKESRDTMKRTGATGAHFHIGKDSTYAKRYADRMAELARASKIAPAVSTAVYNPYILQQQATLPYPEVVSTPTTLPAFPSEVELEYQRKQQEAAENRYRFNMAMNVLKLLNGEQDPAESFLQNFIPNPSIPLFDGLPEDQYAHGGKIRIKPSHRGRLTELKKRTGKTEAELYRTGSPAVRKMITFARSARKWKHADGGHLFGLGSSLEVDNYPEGYWENRREHAEVKPGYRRTKKDVEYWEKKNKRNAEAAEKFNRKADTVMSQLSDIATSTPVTGEEVKQAAEDQRQKDLQKFKDYKKGIRALVTAAELGMSGGSLLGAYANWKNWASAANALNPTRLQMAKANIANLLQNAQAPMQVGGTLIDSYQTYDAATKHDDFDKKYNAGSTFLGSAGYLGARDYFRGRYPWIDRALDTAGILQNAGDFIKFGYDTYTGNQKANGGPLHGPVVEAAKNLYDGTIEPTQKMEIGADYWKKEAEQPTIMELAAEQYRQKQLEEQQKLAALRQAVATKGKELAEKRAIDYTTASNDATSVAGGRPQNTHLEEKAVRGGEAHAAWEKEHPNLTAWGNLAGAVPLAVAAAPLGAAGWAGLSALGDAAAATSVGQGITNFLAPIATTSYAGATVPQWLDLGLTSGFGAHGIQTAIDEKGISPMTVLEVAPLSRLTKPVFNEATLAVENYRYPLGRPQVPNDYLTIKPQVRTKVGDVEINNPQLAYRQGGNGIVEDFINSGKVRTKESNAIVDTGKGFTFDFGHEYSEPMFAQGQLNWGLPVGNNAQNTGLLTTSELLGIGNRQSRLIDNVVNGTTDIRMFPTRGRGVTGRVPLSEDQLNATNTTAYNWEPGYGYRKVFAEESPAAEWSVGRTAPEITAENAASITPEQWTAAQDAAIARGDMAEAQRLRDLHLDAKIPSTQVTDLRDLKSADAITYNPETGERIPLGARDDFSNPDIRYSLESDLKGKPAALSAGKVIRKADSDIREMNKYHQANVDAYNEATGSNVQSVPFRTDYTGRRVQVLPNEEFNAKMAEFNVNAPSGTAENIGGVYSKRNDTVYLRSTGNPSNNYHEFLHSARYGETNPEVTRWRISQLVDEDKVANMSPKEKGYYLSEMEAPTHLRQQGEKFNIEIGQEYPGDEAFDELWNSGVGGASYYMKHSTPEEKRLLWKGWNGTLFGLTAPTVITAAVAANSQALGGPIVQDALKHQYDGISEKTQKMQKASPYRYVLGEDGKWNMVDNDEMTRVFQGFTVTPNGSKKKFIPEKIDNSMEAAVRRDKFLQNRNENGTLIGEFGLELVHPEFDAIALAPLAGMAGKYAANKISTAAANYAAEHPGIYQYPRYAIGKLKYGFDAELPTLYRKVKGIPAVENGRLQVSNPNNRFAFDNGYGEESPLLTNFTTDAPVRSHGAGNWDRGLTLSFPGKTLLGKKVVSTRPSDTFIIGDNITVPTKNVQAFTGRPKEIQFLNDNGIKVTTSPDAQMFFESGVDDYMAKAAKYRADRQKILQMKAEGKGPVLLRPKAPLDNFTNYAREIEDLTREAHKAPTAKDYAFMDYVFRPQFTSQTMPVVDDLTVEAVENFPLLGEWAGNVERLRYLDDFSRWRNVMYDPLTGAEADFRRSLNIGLKPLFKK